MAPGRARRRAVDLGRAGRREAVAGPPGQAAPAGAGRAGRPHRGRSAAVPTPGSVIPNLALDTAIAAYLLDPAETRYGIGDLLERYTGDRLPEEGAPSGPARLQRGGGRRGAGGGAGGARRQPPRPGRPGRARRAGHGRAVHRDREPARAGAGPHGGRRHRRRPGRARVAQHPPDGGVRSPGRPAARGGGPGLQPQLAHPAAPDPLRGARPQPHQADQDRAVDRRRHAGEAAGRVARVHRPAAAVPGGREAPLDLRRGAAGRGRARRSHPRHVQPDGGPDRAALVGPAQPPQHPGPVGRGAAVPPGLHRRARQHPARRRLQPDRAAVHRPPGRGPRARGRLHRRPGHPHGHRVAGVRRRAGRRHRPDALHGQDDQLRPGLRDGGLRAGPAAQHPDRGGRAHPQRVLRRLPQRARLHGAHGQGGPHAGLHGDAVRAPPPHPGAVELQLPHPPGRRAPGHERRHPGPGGRHLQGRAGPARPRAGGRSATPAASSCRCTTRCCSRCPTPSTTPSAR